MESINLGTKTSLQLISTVLQTNGIKHKWLFGGVIHLRGNEKYNYFNRCRRVINHARLGTGNSACSPCVQDVQVFWAVSRNAGVGSDVVGTQRAPTASPKPLPGSTGARQASWCWGWCLELGSSPCNGIN